MSCEFCDVSGCGGNHFHALGLRDCSLEVLALVRAAGGVKPALRWLAERHLWFDPADADARFVLDHLDDPAFVEGPPPPAPTCKGKEGGGKCCSAR